MAMSNSNSVDGNNNNGLSDKFSVKNNSLVNRKFNKMLCALIDVNTWQYGVEVSPFVSALKNDQLCSYQSDLIRSYLKSPEDNLVLDCDRLTLTMRCSEKVIELVMADKGIQHFRIKNLAKILAIKKVPEGSVNDNTYGSNKPYYNHAFNIEILNEYTVKLYIADGKGCNNGVVGMRIDFIPERLTGFEFRCVFGHLKSVISHKRYEDLMAVARVTRVDVGFNMPGVFSAFVFITLKGRRIKAGSCWPLGDGIQIIEACYLGNKEKSSHFIAYDKILKEMADLVREGKVSPSMLITHFNTLAATTRIEYKYYPYRSHTVVPLSALGNVRVRLEQLKIVDPKTLPYAPDDLLANLARDKTLEAVKYQKTHIKSAVDGKFKARVFSLKKGWMDHQSVKLLMYYQKLIMEPKTVKNHEIKDYLAKL